MMPRAAPLQQGFITGQGCQGATSLVVQRLKLRLPMQAVRVQSVVVELRSQMP